MATLPARPTSEAGDEPVATTLFPVRRRITDSAPEPNGRRLAALSLAALGVVFGDIGTSPLYAFRECFHPDHGIAATSAAVYGVLSLIVWALILIVSVKYVVFIMRLDNRGEGGILALLALVQPTRRRGGRPQRAFVVGLGLFGAALLYGDGVITPAISVLSATEGLEIASPGFEPYVVPAALVVLFTLFMLQRRGSARVGSIFGPIMVVWFTTIAALGVVEIAHAPEILGAINPWHGVRFLTDHGAAGFLVLGGVPLVIAGVAFLLMETWKRGGRLLTAKLDRGAVPLDEFLAEIARTRPVRVPGTAVYLTHATTTVPLVLLHHYRHAEALHERIVLLSVIVEEIPEVDDRTRVRSEPLSEGFYRVRATYGFMERADVPAIVRRCCRDLDVGAGDVTYYLGRARLVPTGPMPMMRWRKSLFAFMAWNAAAATDFFSISPDRVVELGAQIEL